MSVRAWKKEENFVGREFGNDTANRRRPAAASLTAPESALRSCHQTQTGHFKKWRDTDFDFPPILATRILCEEFNLEEEPFRSKLAWMGCSLSGKVKFLSLLQVGINVEN